MCGIFGWIKPSARFETNLDLTQIFRDGLLNSQVRGEFATGFYSLGTGTVKKTMKAVDFVKKGNVPDIQNERFVIGHCRWASAKYRGDAKGLQNPSNAHPLESDNWVIVHNGTIETPRLKGYKYRSQTDSEIIISYAEKLSLKNALSSIDGSAAIVLYDKKNQKIYFWTNGERPLIVAYYKGMIFFSSTKKILRETLKYKRDFGIFPEASFATIYEMEPLVFDLRRNRFTRQALIEKKIIKKKTVHATYSYKSFLPVPAPTLTRGCGPSCPPPPKAGDVVGYCPGNGNNGKVVKIGGKR